MGYNSYFRCGGSIIGPKYVITAGHCTYGIEGENVTKVTIKAGSSFLSSGGIFRTVVEIFIHPKFNIDTLDYDSSILELAEDLPIGSIDYHINVIDLPSESESLVFNNIVRVAGWGTTSSGGSVSDQLRYVDVPVTLQSTCKVKYFPTVITDQMVCAGTILGGKDSCQGDSGGPLIFNGKLHGSVSFGNGCGLPLFPGVYCRIPTVRGWIYSITLI